MDENQDLKLTVVSRFDQEDLERMGMNQKPHVGQEVEINGVICRIRKITNKDLVLRLVRRRDALTGYDQAEADRQVQAGMASYTGDLIGG